MGLGDVLKGASAISSIVGEARRVTNFVSESIMSKKDLKKEIEELKQECRSEQRRRQSIEIAIKVHKQEMLESNHPRRFDCDEKLWRLIETNLEPNGAISDHPLPGKKKK